MNLERAGEETAGWLADTRDALRFFTRLPVVSAGGDHSLPPFSRTLRAFPLVGIATGGIQAVVLILFAWLTGSPVLAAIAALAAGLLTTGAFHEDGLADMADGFGGGWEKTHKLEIMKDSRLGTYGAAALLLSLSFRAAAIALLAERLGPAAAGAALIGAEAVSRAASLHIGYALPAVRREGASYAAGRPSGQAYASAWIAALLIGVVTAWPATSFLTLALASACAALAALGTAWLAQRQIGGQTGDVAGAAQQICLIAFLAVLAAFTHL
ncbi:MAG: adenosylcobinamide-GDP ribazoletransferase [Flavobacteriaceae bacterium]